MTDTFDIDGFLGEVSGNDNSSTNTDKLPTDWVPEDALDNLVEERSVNPGSTNCEIAKKVLTDNAPLAAQRLVQLALYSRSDTVALRASQAVMNLAFESAEKGATALDQFLAGLEGFANGTLEESTVNRES